MKNRVFGTVLLVAFAVAFAPYLAAGEEEGGEKEKEKVLVTWLENHEEAAKAAKEGGKLIIAHLTTSRCGWCRKIENETYPDAKVQELLKTLVPVRIWLDRPDNEFGQSLMKKARARGVPTILILDGDWNVIRYIRGYKPPGPFLEEVNKGLKAYEDFQALYKKVREGEPDYDMLHDFLKACHEMKRTKEIKEYGEKALAMEIGLHHADIAFYVANACGFEGPEYAKYKEMLMKLDPENKTGHFDQLTIDEARHALAPAKSMEEFMAAARKARKIIEDRLAMESPKPLVEKEQMMCAMLFDWYFLRGKGDKEKALGFLRKGVELAPESEMGKKMASFIKRLGG